VDQLLELTGPTPLPPACCKQLACYPETTTYAWSSTTIPPVACDGSSWYMRWRNLQPTLLYHPQLVMAFLILALTQLTAGWWLPFLCTHTSWHGQSCSCTYASDASDYGIETADKVGDILTHCYELNINVICQLWAVQSTILTRMEFPFLTDAAGVCFNKGEVIPIHAESYRCTEVQSTVGHLTLKRKKL
jgi:hypothetical protein